MGKNLYFIDNITHVLHKSVSEKILMKDIHCSNLIWQ